MSQRQERFSMGFLMAWLGIMSGCATAAPADARDERTDLPSGFEFTISGGQEDLKNRYRSVLMVGSERGLCSGVLMTPRLVLTAAHCLCLPAGQPGEGQHIDSSDCATNVTAVLHSYEVGVDPAHSVKSNPRSLQGVASAYPGFKAVMQQGRVASFEGDLAVVRLEKPVTEIKIDFRLPSTEVALDETLTMVGFGETHARRRDVGRRRFGQNVVTNILLESGGNGVFAFHALGAHSQSGDSGGPCFREDKKGRWLVGINSGNANGGTISLFTSTFHYRSWISEQIRKAEAD